MSAGGRLPSGLGTGTWHLVDRGVEFFTDGCQIWGRWGTIWCIEISLEYGVLG